LHVAGGPGLHVVQLVWVLPGPQVPAPSQKVDWNVIASRHVIAHTVEEP
jgi:hypothetical protein